MKSTMVSTTMTVANNLLDLSLIYLISLIVCLIISIPIKSCEAGLPSNASQLSHTYLLTFVFITRFMRI
jgi:hypothetical protein